MVDLSLYRLIVSGDRKDYIVKFKKGLNIILGDSDTGKSSILELVNYALGASKIGLYTELESTGRSCCLELSLGGKVCTIKRNLLNPNQYVLAYTCSYDDIGSFGKPLFLAPNFQSQAPDGFLSDFIMSSLGLPVIKIKEAPSKQDSKMVRLSFRDLFKYIYLDQDDVGSKGIFDQNNFSVRVKNKEVFKFIFDFLDVRITQLQQSISELTQEKNRLKTKLEIIQEFLAEAKFENAIDIEKRIFEVEGDLRDIEKALSTLSKSMIANTSLYFDIKKAIANSNDEVEKLRILISESRRRINEYVKLKNDYIQDIDKLKTSQKMASVASSFQQEILCPICSNKIKPSEYLNHFDKTDLSVVKDEIKFLTRRKKELVDLINQERISHQSLEEKLEDVVSNLSDLRIHFDTKTKELITPFIQERDGLVSYKTQLNEEIKHRKELLQIAKSKISIMEHIDAAERSLKSQTDQLEAYLSEVKSEEGILDELGDLLDSYLKFVSIKNKTGIGISKSTYLPIVRGKDYSDLTSGGLRTIVSIGYFLSILRFNLLNSISLPPIVMVDTVGKYLSKYTKQKYLIATDLREDQNEYVDDPEKYTNIYKFMIQTVEMAELNNKTCQIIVVDNDLPTNLSNELTNVIIIEFKIDDSGNYPKGFIDDA